MQQVQLQIPEPCHENWGAMQAAEKGRFCLSCQKTVVDFTNMTDHELLQYLQAVQGNTCGRFAPDQLNRPLTPQTPVRKRFWAKLVFQLLFPAFVFTQKARAQGMISMVKIQPPLTTALQKKPTQQPYFVLKGRVTDSISGEPLAFASVQIKGSSIGVQTDGDGHFTISLAVLPKHLTLVVSIIGYTTQELVIKDSRQPANILLSPTKKELAEVVVTSYENMGRICRHTTGLVATIADSVTCTKPTVMQRITDTLTGSNNIRIYPNPVNRGSAVQLNMKKVKKGQYRLQLFSASGSLVQQELITVPAEDFNFQWALGSQLAAGNYIVTISQTNGKAIHNSQLTVLQ